jgi:hypothetical protein
MNICARGGVCPLLLISSVLSADILEHIVGKADHAFIIDAGSVGSDSGDHIRRAVGDPIPLNLDREIDR